MRDGLFAAQSSTAACELFSIPEESGKIDDVGVKAF